MRRFSLNTLKNSFELGNTSSWVISFEGVGSKSPDVSKLNIINGEYCPVIEVSYDDLTVVQRTMKVGPGVNISLPVFLQNTPMVLSITFYDDHKESIRTEIKRWVRDVLEIDKGKAPTYDELKDSSLLAKIYHFDKQGNPLSNDAFYLLPAENFARRGDQSFSAETAPIAFSIIGKQ